jgi:hypothetical protein
MDSSIAFTAKRRELRLMVETDTCPHCSSYNTYTTASYIGPTSITYSYADNSTCTGTCNCCGKTQDSLSHLTIPGFNDYDPEEEKELRRLESIFHTRQSWVVNYKQRNPSQRKTFALRHSGKQNKHFIHIQ